MIRHPAAGPSALSLRGQDLSHWHPLARPSRWSSSTHSVLSRARLDLTQGSCAAQRDTAHCCCRRLLGFGGEFLFELLRPIRIFTV